MKAYECWNWKYNQIWSQGRHNKPFLMKFGVRAYSIGFLLCAIFGHDQWKEWAQKPQISKSVKFAWLLCVKAYTDLGQIWHWIVHLGPHSHAKFSPDQQIVWAQEPPKFKIWPKFGEIWTCGNHHLSAVFWPCRGDRVHQSWWNLAWKCAPWAQSRMPYLTLIGEGELKQLVRWCSAAGNPAWGRGTSFPPLLLPCPFIFSSFALYYFFPFSFSHPLYLFSFIVYPIPFYQNRPTPFPGVRS